MAYCKHCGMDSSDASKCEWCGRRLDGTTAMPPQPVPPIEDTSPQARLERVDEEEQQARKVFFVSAAIMLAVGTVLIIVKLQTFPYVILASSVLIGRWLTRNRIVDPYDDDFLEVALVFVAVLLFPMFVVYLIYVGYGLINRNLNISMAWLFGSYLVAVTILEIVTCIAIGLTHAPAIGSLITLLGVEKLGFIAAIIGWKSTSQ